MSEASKTRAFRSLPGSTASPTTWWPTGIATGAVARWSPWTTTSVRSGCRSIPEAEAVASEERDQLLAVVRRLPEERQQLLILKFVERLSNAEIGQVMGRTEGAIKSLYHRTLNSLREELVGARAHEDGGAGGEVP